MKGVNEDELEGETKSIKDFIVFIGLRNKNVNDNQVSDVLWLHHQILKQTEKHVEIVWRSAAYTFS